MTTSTTAGRAGLGMYPFAPLVEHYEQLWELVREAEPSLPASLDWDSDLHAFWRDPALVVNQTCGWPLVTELADLVAAGSVRVVGTFVHTVPDALGPTYRSVLVTRSGLAVAEPADLAGMHAAANSFASLSGWVSLLHAVHGPGATWHGAVTLTGAHVESLRALQDGRVEVASIDAVSFAHVRRWMPELVRDLAIVGSGPRVPCLPLIAGPALQAVALDDLRRAFAQAVADPRAADLRDALLIERFESLDAADYEALHGLAPAPQ